MPIRTRNLYKKILFFGTLNKKISSGTITTLIPQSDTHCTRKVHYFTPIMEHNKMFLNNKVKAGYTAMDLTFLYDNVSKRTLVSSSFPGTAEAHPIDPIEEDHFSNDPGQTKEGSSLLKDVAVAIDCEMVECGYTQQALARCSVVDYNSNVIEDIYVKPDIYVTDYRTRYSGITPKHLRSPSCVNFKVAQKRIATAIENKIVIGHSVDIDLGVLGLRVPCNHLIDIKSISAINKLMVDNGWEYKGGFSLKKLTKTLLKRNIQVKTHCSVEDASATMEVFKIVEGSWMNENSWIIQDLCDRKKYLEDRFWPEDFQNK